MFWERDPYVWDDEEGRVSRFVSLGAFGGPPTEGKKQRVGITIFKLKVTILTIIPQWFYAFSIEPDGKTAPTRPANATQNPFTESMPRSVKRTFDDSQGPNSFIFGDVKQPGKRARVGKCFRAGLRTYS